MIVRDIATAATRSFDLVVIGGGIHGVSLLQQAARRGLSACLCEAADFGGGTSGNTLRILHGGVRHLQSLSLGRFYQSIRARRCVAQLFPTLIRPLNCLMPLYGQGLKRPSVMRLGLMASNLLDLRRNSGLSAAVRLPAGRVLDAAATRREFPMVRQQGLQGAACWSDYFMVSSERILMELLRDACRHGALALNYAPVVDILSENRRVRGVQVRDLLSSSVQSIAARWVVNCAGPRLAELARDLAGAAASAFHPSLALNLLLDVKLPGRHALAVAAPWRDAPILFLLPQAEALLVGTLHLPRPAGTVDASPSPAEIDRFLDLLNAAVPGLGATPGRVRRVFAGLLPAAGPGSADLARREAVVDHGALGGLQGLYSVSGVKFTTAGEVAHRMLALMGVAPGAFPVAELPLSSATALLMDVRRLWANDGPALAAELRCVVAEESVHCLDDLILRRGNWALEVPELERLRGRVAPLLNLPAAVA